MNSDLLASSMLGKSSNNNFFSKWAVTKTMVNCCKEGIILPSYMGIGISHYKEGIFHGSNAGFQMVMIFIPCSRDQNGFLSLNPGIYYSSYRVFALKNSFPEKRITTMGRIRNKITKITNTSIPVILDRDSWQPKKHQWMANLCRERPFKKLGYNVWRNKTLRFWYRCSTSGSSETLWYLLKTPRLWCQLIKNQPIPRLENMLMFSLTSRKLSIIAGSSRMVGPSNTRGSLPSQGRGFQVRQFFHSISAFLGCHASYIQKDGQAPWNDEKKNVAKIMRPFPSSRCPTWSQVNLKGPSSLCRQRIIGSLGRHRWRAPWWMSIHECLSKPPPDLHDIKIHGRNGVKMWETTGSDRWMIRWNHIWLWNMFFPQSTTWALLLLIFSWCWKTW